MRRNGFFFGKKCTSSAIWSICFQYFILRWIRSIDVLDKRIYGASSGFLEDIAPWKLRNRRNLGFSEKWSFFSGKKCILEVVKNGQKSGFFEFFSNSILKVHKHIWSVLGHFRKSETYFETSETIIHYIAQ